MGPMFSGKSTELIRRLKRYQIARYECLIVRYSKDNRYSDKGIATHDKQSLKAISANLCQQLTDKVDYYDVIGIDEGQFVRGKIKMYYLSSFIKKQVGVAAWLECWLSHLGVACQEPRS